MDEAATVGVLLDRADAERAAGRGEAAARLYDEAADRCRDLGDLPGWTRSVLGSASVYVFGAEPGNLPARLYDVLARTTDGASRARLNAALARCWAYAGEAVRAAPFAEAALADAEGVGDPELLADCLDAALAAHWGPDDLGARGTLVRRLDEVAAHVVDPEARLRAHLWGLQVACEALDLQAMHRQMRALERLGEESPRALFFAASRRQMLDLLRGRTETASELRRVAAVASDEASLADAWMVLESMSGYAAVQSGDSTTCAAVAEAMESFGLTEGAPTVCAEAAYLWTAAGRPDRAEALVRTFHGGTLDGLPRDVNWLLTLQCVLEAALAVDDREVVAQAARLLTPYAGRAVFNAGAVMFHGVTDDPLARAAALMGDEDEARRLGERALAVYERLGAQWWRSRLAASMAAARRPVRVHRAHLRQVPGGLWLVGTNEAPVPLAALRGFGYLRELLGRPGRPVAALDLVGEGAGVVDQPDLGDLVDDQALAAYRRRLTELDQELAEAEEWADLGRVDLLRSEQEALVHEIAAATGLGGRRRTTGSSQERARVAVQKAIRKAVDQISSVDGDLGRHLRDSVRTGHECSYRPAADEAWEWVLD